MSYVFPRRGVGDLGYAYYAAHGLGGIDFNASSVWTDWVAGAPPTNDNAAGARAAKAIQAGLNEIGYGPIAVDGQFGSGSIAAWNKFANANSVPTDWPTQVGVTKLGEQIAAGGNQGGGTVSDYHIVNGQYVPGAAPGTSKAGMSSTMIGIGIAALVGIGILAIVAKKKKTGSTSVAMTAHKVQ